VSAAREEILSRVRAALRDAPALDGAPPYAPPAVPAGFDAVGLFAARVADYKAVVRRVDVGDLASAIAAAFAGHDAGRVGVPPGLQASWRPGGLAIIEDDRLSVADLDALDGALTGCALAIAETGTIVLDGGERSGRRALTLVPDLHVCVVEAAQVVASVPEAIRTLEGGRGPFTFVSGPSATSDIELNRVEGVHGPRRLEVLLCT